MTEPANEVIREPYVYEGSSMTDIFNAVQKILEQAISSGKADENDEYGFVFSAFDGNHRGSGKIITHVSTYCKSYGAPEGQFDGYTYMRTEIERDLQKQAHDSGGIKKSI